jgi:hypothetical protein
MPPIDVDATVIANRRLSRDYNVLTLGRRGRRAHSGGTVRDGAPGWMTETLLRRLSVFEVVRDERVRPRPSPS